MSTVTIHEPEPMGTVLTTLTITNRIDQARAASGDIPQEQMRRITVEDILVDTGATMLCLPADLTARLGLEPLRSVAIATATGSSRTRIFQDAKITLLGRETTVECIELPEGARPLLGVIPLEALGIELDLKNRTLRLLPDETSDTYLTVM